MSIQQPPEGECPKCGAPDAFLLSDPRYEDMTSSYSPMWRWDRILWTCRRCGFERWTRTNDYTPPPTLVAYEPTAPKRKWWQR